MPALTLYAPGTVAVGSAVVPGRAPGATWESGAAAAAKAASSGALTGAKLAGPVGALIGAGAGLLWYAEAYEQAHGNKHFWNAVTELWQP